MSDCIHKIQTACKTWSTASKISRYSKCRQTIKTVQARKLQTIIKYAYENIKYYRELFDENKIMPQSIKDVKDLSAIPCLTKDILRQRFWDFLPSQLQRCKVSRTSGSTGMPMCILADENSRINNSAAVIRYRKIYGIKFFSGEILTPLKTPDTPDKTPYWTFLQGLHKTYYVNPYHYSNFGEQILKQLKKPAIIGITPAIKALALSIKDNILPPIDASIVITTGQSYDAATGKLLENIFDAPVADVYASNEAGDVAWQCPRSGCYHINDENVIVEIENPDEHSFGEVVITNLNRFSMPFIRYKNGDLAKKSDVPCQCGIKLSMLAEIAGRTGDNILLPDGRTIYWHHIKSVFTHQQLRQFQLIQHADLSLELKVVIYSGADLKQMEKIFRLRLGKIIKNVVSFKITETTNIAPCPSGKTKLVVRSSN